MRKLFLSLTSNVGLSTYYYVSIAPSYWNISFVALNGVFGLIRGLEKGDWDKKVR